MGFPPQSASMVQPGPVVPRSPVDSQFYAAWVTMHSSSPPAGPAYPSARPGFQSAFPGYISHQNTAGAQVQPRRSLAFPSQQGGYVPTMPATSSPYLAQQGGYAAPPSVASQLGNSREQMQHPGSTPSMAVMQGLMEDFSSFSIGSVPGSFDPGFDSKVLPRSLEGDVERNTLSEMYPMNCSSRYLRLTTSGIPNSQSLALRWHLTLGLVVSPLAEAPNGEEVPVVNFARTGIIRCKRCRTYVNPYVTFTDSGRKWRCNLCALLNDVPGEYFAHLDASGRRIDLDQRPELTKGSVEFIAPTDYMVRPPMPPLYFFLIDVSVSAVKSGILEISSILSVFFVSSFLGPLSCCSPKTLEVIIIYGLPDELKLSSRKSAISMDTADCFIYLIYGVTLTQRTTRVRFSSWNQFENMPGPVDL